MEINGYVEKYFETHYFSSQKLILITFNKGASRYTSDFFANDMEAVVQFTDEFDINGCSIIQSPNPDSKTTFSKKDIIKEWNSVLDKTCTKDVIFLYRNPYKRLISGIIQEFGSTLSSGNTGNDHDQFNFPLKAILQSYTQSEETYQFIQKHRGSFINKINDKLDRNIVNNITNVFKKYLHEFSKTSIVNTNHTYLYFSYLHYFINSDKIDTNKIKIIDLDNMPISLEEIYNTYELQKLEGRDNTLSNKYMVEIYQSILRNNNDIKYNFANIESMFMSAISTEMFFYRKLKESKYNLK